MFNDNIKASPNSQRYVPISRLSTNPWHIKEYARWSVHLFEKFGQCGKSSYRKKNDNGELFS